MLSIIGVLAVFPSLYKLVFIILIYLCFLYGVCRLFKKAFPLRRSFTVCIAVSIIIFYFFTAVTSIGNKPLLYEKQCFGSTLVILENKFIYLINCMLNVFILYYNLPSVYLN